MTAEAFSQTSIDYERVEKAIFLVKIQTGG